MAIKVKFLKLHPDAAIPFKTHPSDFCYDCVAVSREEVAPNVYKYGLGFALQAENVATLQGFTIRARSSVWRTGLVLSNGIGTVDSGYTGEISAVFYHVQTSLPPYKVGDKVCQLHFDVTHDILFLPATSLASTGRGTGGYGSTDKKQ